MSKSIIYIDEQSDSPLRIDICSGEDWDGFDEIIEYLINNLEVEVLKSFDGPDARRWILKLKEITFELIHDDVSGNYLLAPTKESETVIKNIANIIDNKFKDDPSFLR
tara:strand:- start:387 stop:710 length:324 start_codon:yes stop_codon:yes gene_type:complete